MRFRLSTIIYYIRIPRYIKTRDGRLTKTYMYKKTAGGPSQVVSKN
jgi:hypothetical protein